jgi:hypothetical protein
MELALNLVWVCVAIVGIGLLCRSLAHTAACPDPPGGHWRKIVAMSCALIILFFVISMTDDLHDQEIVVEENKFSRIVLATGTSAASTPCHVISGVFLVDSALASFAHVLPSERRLIDRPKAVSAAAILCNRVHSRAPPASPA